MEGYMIYTAQNCVTEFYFTSGKKHRDPFNEVELDLVVTDPDGIEQRVPAYWAGEQTWTVRYSSPKVGLHSYRTVCSDASDADLHGREGTIKVVPYKGKNPLLRHGPIRVAADRRHFEHVDGTPFFWLGDTWWMGLCKRLRWPDDFQTLTADRVSKGFSVIQIVAGLYPDMPPFDERGANEAGFPWDKDYKRINPHYFDMADLRIQWLVRSGLVPCIVGCWGYFLEFTSVEVLKKHWRNLLARYGAYPVVWCMAGEATMLYYLSPALGDPEKSKQAVARARAGWTEITRYLRSIDPYHRPITLHPSSTARECVDDVSVMDFDMLQTGHGGRDSLPNTVNRVVESLGKEPKMPVVVGEVCYEGIGGQSWEEVQRFAFWASILSGAGGHTYGANGIWQVNTREAPYGASPHGMAWGHTPWEDAYRLPGSTQLGIAKRLLERYPWWKFEPHPEWTEPHSKPENRFLPYAAGIPRSVRVIFMPLAWWTPPLVKGIEPGTSYRAFLFDVLDGSQTDLGTVQPDAKGNWQPPRIPVWRDWVLVLENKA